MTPALTDIEIFMPHSAVECYSHSGSNFFPVTNQCERYAEIMGDDYVRLSFSLYDNVFFDAFAHINYDGEDFFLEDDYSPNYDNGVYVYDLKFVSIGNLLKKPFVIHNTSINIYASHIREFENIQELSLQVDIDAMAYQHDKSAANWRLLCNSVYHDNETNKYYRFSGYKYREEKDVITGNKILIITGGNYEDFNFTEFTQNNFEVTFSSTDKMLGLLEVIVNSIRHFNCPEFLKDKLDLIVNNFFNASDLERSSFVKNTFQMETFSFDGTCVYDALNEIANAFDTEWYILNNTLFIKGYITDDAELALSDTVVKNNSRLVRTKTLGLLQCNFKDSTPNLPQIIYPCGSDRNITQSQILNGVNGRAFEYNKYLKLLPNTTYTVKDAEGNNTTITTNNGSGVEVADVHTGIESKISFDDIYPRCYYQVTKVFSTVTNNGQYKYHIQAQALKDDNRTLYTAEEMMWLGILPKNNVTDGQEGQTPAIIFESGFLNGMEFDIAIKSVYSDLAVNIAACELVIHIKNRLNEGKSFYIMNKTTGSVDHIHGNNSTNIQLILQELYDTMTFRAIKYMYNKWQNVRSSTSLTHKAAWLYLGNTITDEFNNKREGQLYYDEIVFCYNHQLWKEKFYNDDYINIGANGDYNIMSNAEEKYYKFFDKRSTYMWYRDLIHYGYGPRNGRGYYVYEDDIRRNIGDIFISSIARVEHANVALSMELPDGSKLYEKTIFELDELIASYEEVNNQYAMYLHIVPEMGMEDEDGESRIKYPQGMFIPTVGDNFSLVNIKMPDGFVTKARQELAQATYDYIAEQTKSTRALSCVGDPNFFNTEFIRLGRKTDIFSRIIGNNSGFKFDDMFLHPNRFNIKEYFNSIEGKKTISSDKRTIELFITKADEEIPYVRPSFMQRGYVPVQRGLNAITFMGGSSGVRFNIADTQCYFICYINSMSKTFVLHKDSSEMGLEVKTFNNINYYRVDNINDTNDCYLIRTPVLQDLVVDDVLYDYNTGDEIDGTWIDSVHRGSDIDVVIRGEQFVNVDIISKNYNYNNGRCVILFNVSSNMPIQNEVFVYMDISGINGVDASSENYIILRDIKAEPLKEGENPTEWCPILEDIQHNKSHVVKMQHKLTTPQEVSFETATIRKIGYLESNRIKINSLFNQQKNK